MVKPALFLRSPSQYCSFGPVSGSQKGSVPIVVNGLAGEERRRAFLLPEMLTETAIQRVRRVALQRLRRLTSETEVAQDLAQETTIRLLQYQGPITNLDGLAMKTAYNLFLSWKRQMRREVRNGPLPQSIDNSMQHELDAHSDRSALVRAVQQLPEPQRDVMLILMEGGDSEDCVRILNIKPGTVKSRLSRARKTLRPLLDAA